MAAGIQHVQAAQFIEVSSPSTGDMVTLTDKKRSTLTLKVVHISGAGHHKAGTLGGDEKSAGVLAETLKVMNLYPERYRKDEYS
jgi:hypothetical protein